MTENIYSAINRNYKVILYEITKKHLFSVCEICSRKANGKVKMTENIYSAINRNYKVILYEITKKHLFSVCEICSRKANGKVKMIENIYSAYVKYTSIFIGRLKNGYRKSN